MHIEACWLHWEEEFYYPEGETESKENERRRAREGYWQTLLFNRAAQIQTQSWPVIGRLWLGLGMGCSDSCLEMMEAPEKGDREVWEHDNKTRITVKFCCPSPSSPHGSD